MIDEILLCKAEVYFLRTFYLIHDCDSHLLNWAVQYVWPMSNAASSCKVFDSLIIQLI